MRKTIEGLFLGILFLFIGCLPKQADEYYIKGTISKEHDGEMVMLFMLLGDSIVSVDTTIIKKGAFKFHGKENIRDFSVITTGNFPDRVLSAEVILESGKISVHLDSVSVVLGALLQPLYESYIDSLTFLYKELEKTYQIINGKVEHINDSAMNKAHAELTNYVLRVLRNNANNVIGKRAFDYYAYTASDEEVYNVYELFDETTKSNPDIISTLDDRMKASGERVEREKMLNSVFQDFELIATDGTIKRISDYVGKSKYLFIDFWASWCGPCIADFPYLVDVYSTYQEKGLEILGISFDSSETAWKKALETHYVSWEMVMAKNEKEMRNAYAISGIPYGILLDDKGCIVEIGLIGSFLPLVIKKYLN